MAYFFSESAKPVPITVVMLFQNSHPVRGHVSESSFITVQRPEVCVNHFATYAFVHHMAPNFLFIAAMGNSGANSRSLCPSHFFQYQNNRDKQLVNCAQKNKSLSVRVVPQRQSSRGAANHEAMYGKMRELSYFPLDMLRCTHAASAKSFVRSQLLSHSFAAQNVDKVNKTEKLLHKKEVNNREPDPLKVLERPLQTLLSMTLFLHGFCGTDPFTNSSKRSKQSETKS
jgi:hypothetical protein